MDRKIVFTRFQSDGKEMFNDIFAIDPDGKNETRLTMNPGPTGEYTDNAAPRYNKDRTMIAFVSTKNNPGKFYNIFFMDLATRKTAQITNGNLNISSVDWSPDDSTPRLLRLRRQGGPAGERRQDGRHGFHQTDRRPGRAHEPACGRPEAI